MEKPVEVVLWHASNTRNMITLWLVKQLIQDGHENMEKVKISRVMHTDSNA